MQPHHRAALSAILTLLCLSLLSGQVHSLGSNDAAHEEAVSSDVSLTPPRGSTLRKEILDAMRQEVKRMHGLEVIFVVVHLKTKDGWAWLHARPRSRDGLNQYEDISGLLQLKDGVWSVVETPCGEVDNPECLDGPEYFTKLQERFPTVASEIFPN
jgi:hypothetical protein